MVTPGGLRRAAIMCLTLGVFFFSGGQVAKLYRDASLGNVVNIIVTRLIVLTEDQVRTSPAPYHPNPHVS